MKLRSFLCQVCIQVALFLLLLMKNFNMYSNIWSLFEITWHIKPLKKCLRKLRPLCLVNEFNRKKLPYYTKECLSKLRFSHNTPSSYWMSTLEVSRNKIKMEESPNCCGSFEILHIATKTRWEVLLLDPIKIYWKPDFFFRYT